MGGIYDVIWQTENRQLVYWKILEKDGWIDRYIDGWMDDWFYNMSLDCSVVAAS